MCKIRHTMTEGSPLFSFKTNSKLVSFAESFAQKVEEMWLQHLSIPGMKGNEPDGLQMMENLPQSKHHSLALPNELRGVV